MDHDGRRAAFDLSPYFDWEVLGAVSLAEATRRVLAYCTYPWSGWGVYDLAARSARDAGLLDTVAPWSLLFANALNGQVTLTNVADFTRERREDFARRVHRVPSDVDLVDMGEATEAVVDACLFGFRGVWGPKITKLGALYRPRSIPVLDGHVAQAFGFSSSAFSLDTRERGLDRRARIGLAIRALSGAIRDHTMILTDVRSKVAEIVPEIAWISDLRLIDIVIWTSQDDRMERRRKSLNRWVEAQPGERVPTEAFEPIPIGGHVEPHDA